MTIEMKDLLTRQLDTAKSSDEIDHALIAAMKCLVDCQYKTAERVKEMRIDADRRKSRIEGAKWLWGVLGALAASGGGATLLRLFANFH